MTIKKYALIMIIIAVSLIGFCVENVFTAFSIGVINNKNMILPFLLGYGLAILAFYLIFGTPKDPRFLNKTLTFNSKLDSSAYYFAIAFLCVSIGEIILGYLTQWCCDIIWWDYTSIPLHITRYTSIPTSFIFALLITVFMKYFFDPLLNGFMKMNPTALSILSVTLLVLLSLDFINSGIYMFKNHDVLQIWRINLKKPISQFILDML